MTSHSTARSPGSRVQANRERIFSAAISLFEDKGFDEVTMTEIATEAGVARASVFNHFPTKLSILGEWFERFTRDAIAEAYRQPGTGAWHRLSFLLDAFAVGAQENRKIMVHVASLAMGHGPLAATEAELDDELRAYFSDVIRDGQATGELKPDFDPAFLADMWVGLLTVTAHDWVNRGLVSDFSQDLTMRFSALFNGIQK